ncbi:MAG: universal stress protein [Nitrososphaera sp.]|jgi:nucleotide-binding universal stress UspA family protein
MEKILVPIDGSENSRRALEHAVSMAKNASASITILHVIDMPPTVYIESQKLLDQLLASFRQESAKVLDEFRTLAQNLGVNVVQTAAVEGDAAKTIVQYADRGGFDLIVIGSRGLGGVKGLLLESVSAAVVQTAKIPVMVVK